ncbi:MAG: FAD-dependent monooxygenase [Pirellulales bacterium]|nr:FAD-dependent monooxygenase [Pirellulales bacterium]
MTRSDVLIIGAGPSGLFVAAELARHGVEARLVERDVRLHRQARATAIQPGTLEILESVGVLDAFLNASERIHCSRLYGPGMVELGTLSHAGMGCCCDFECCLPQYETQRVLEKHLHSLGGAIERGVTATKVEAADERLVVELSHVDGRVETVEPRFLIGAGGAHSITRHSMNEPLEGLTYRGNFLVADIGMAGPFPCGEAGVICGRHGLLLLAPLPHGRWITFQDLEEEVESVTAEEVVSRVERRLDGNYRPTDVSWFTPFRMHRRIVSRLSDGRRFLIGDAAHLSSPFGGEGLNAGLHDAHDLAWKLALVIRGLARPTLLEAYTTERHLADRHVLDVSDEVHGSIMEVANATREGRAVQAAEVDPIAAALARNARSMIDVDYAGSPLVVDHARHGSINEVSRPGRWYRDRQQFRGTSHHVLLFGELGDDAAALERLIKRWSRHVRVSHNPHVDPARAGVAREGVVLIRPDGHIGFRFAAVIGEAFASLDQHLESYLIANR